MRISEKGEGEGEGHGEGASEGEMGVVVGMNGRDIRKEDAMKHIAGYFVGIDFTNRGL